jgi:L-2-hydroxyglutarate oxidase LhgO
MYSTDAIVVGAGVIGLAIARELALSGLEVIVLEKESAFGVHTSSRNSEVIHAGLYYPQDSLKAKLCVNGKGMLYQYCRQHNIEHQHIGKYVIATNETERDTLRTIKANAELNGVDDLKFVSQLQLNKCYPDLNITEAIYSPSTGIINSHSLMTSFIGDIESCGSHVVLNTNLASVQINPADFTLTISDGTAIRSKFLINSAGLWARDIGLLLEDNGGYKQTVGIDFVRGRYLSYHGKHPFKHLVYPVPVKAGLGTHLTLDLNGQLRIGPDVETIAEIDYKVTDVEMVKAQMFESVKKYWPSCHYDKLSYSYCGIRPKATLKGCAVNDFVIEDCSKHGVDRLVNLFGIESPGLTSCLAVAKLVKEKLAIG